jgi:hypothetical protein
MTENCLPFKEMLLSQWRESVLFPNLNFAAPPSQHVLYSTVINRIKYIMINSLNADLNAICHLPALSETHPIFHISRIRVNWK